jgi:hypothetical protein
LEPGDTILVIAPMEPLLTLESMNQAHPASSHKNARASEANRAERLIGDSLFDKRTPSL